MADEGLSELVEEGCVFLVLAGLALGGVLLLVGLFPGVWFLGQVAFFILVLGLLVTFEILTRDDADDDGRKLSFWAWVALVLSGVSWLGFLFRGVGWASVLLGVVALAMAVFTIRWVFWAFGDSAGRVERRPTVEAVTLGERGGYVYLIREKSAGHIKIGRSKDPEDRMRTFKLTQPFKTEFEHVIRTGDMYDLEKRLHATFARKRVDGEWFRLSDEDVAWIKRHYPSVD